MTDSIYSNLKQLGGATRIPASPDEAELERVANPQADIRYNVRACGQILKIRPQYGADHSFAARSPVSCDPNHPLPHPISG